MTSIGFEPPRLSDTVAILTNWAMKPLMFGAGQLCVYVPVKEMNVIDVYEIP